MDVLLGVEIFERLAHLCLVEARRGERRLILLVNERVCCWREDATCHLHGGYEGLGCERCFSPAYIRLGLRFLVRQTRCLCLLIAHLHLGRQSEWLDHYRIARLLRLC